MDKNSWKTLKIKFKQLLKINIKCVGLSYFVKLMKLNKNLIMLICLNKCHEMYSTRIEVFYNKKIQLKEFKMLKRKFKN